MQAVAFLPAWRIPDAVGSRGEMVVVGGLVEWRWWWSGWVGAFSGQWVLGRCFCSLVIRGSVFCEFGAGKVGLGVRDSYPEG